MPTMLFYCRNPVRCWYWWSFVHVSSPFQSKRCWLCCCYWYFAHFVASFLFFCYLQSVVWHCVTATVRASALSWLVLITTRMVLFPFRMPSLFIALLVLMVFAFLLFGFGNTLDLFNVLCSARMKRTGFCRVFFSTAFWRVGFHGWSYYADAVVCRCSRSHGLRICDPFCLQVQFAVQLFGYVCNLALWICEWLRRGSTCSWTLSLPILLFSFGLPSVLRTLSFVNVV